MLNLRTFIFAAAIATAYAVSAATPYSVKASSPIVKEDFNSMWNQSAEEASLTLPGQWAIDRNLTAPRTVGSWSEASGEVMYSGGVNLASNAKNGTWNFGDSADDTDRAIGGLTTTVSNGTRGVSLMTAITNDESKPLGRLDISYNIEKYRKGDNPAGFAVQLYFSYDGVEWTPAGDAFRNVFSPDDETLGAEVVPISTTAVSNVPLLIDLQPGKTIYLAWNISVASGSSPNKAPGLAIDDIVVSADYSDASDARLYIENASGFSSLSVYSSTNDYYGAAPGKTTSLTKIVHGVEYLVWDMHAQSTVFDLYAVAGDNTFGPYSVTSSADCYLCVSPSGIEKIDDPENYSGWVDPTRPPFVPSGIYLRGEVNSWGAPDDWEFSNEGDGNYVLYNKSLSGAFKIADSSWASVNYGSNGNNITIDTPYELVSGTDSNISCGSFVFECSRIVLTVFPDGKAALTLESNNDATDLKSVYVIGDFNSWNYMDASGELVLDETDGLFKGRISMKSGSDGLSHWLIYQRLGMSGAWGLADDAIASSLSGILVKGEKGKAAVAPATYDVAFSLGDGSYTLTRVESAPSVMKLNPGKVVLTPVNPEKVKVLSLNNSLIHYNDQDFVFNDIAEAMGKDAVWTKHTNLGKPLSYHWEEGDGLAGDGTPGAKMMVRSDAWSHIILQEQSSLPRNNPEAFRKSVKQWIDYIREYCPNPNAVVIIPVNWAYSSDWSNFSDYNRQFLEVYTDVASELGCVVCPVAAAYDNVYKKEGAEEAGKWFSDDRHPTLQATYMAACMEYATIFGIDPVQITYAPEGLDAAVAQSMRGYASEAVKGYTNVVSHLDGTVRFSARVFDDFGIECTPETPVYSVDGGGTIDSDGVFTSDGTEGEFTVTAKCGGFTESSVVKVAGHETQVVTFPAINLNADNLEASENFDEIGAEAEAELPEGWRIDRQTVAPRTLGTYASAQTATMYSGGADLPSNAKNGLWNFGADDQNDRAPGGITTGVANGTRAINLYTHLFNNGEKNVENITLEYDIEKYRKGNNPAGFAVQLYYSYDGRNWKSAGEPFLTVLQPDTETAGYASVPGETHHVSATLPVDLACGLDLYLAWNISVASGDAANGAMALAIDNISFKGNLPEIPVTNHRIYVDNQTSWDALGLYAWGDSELFGAWPGQAPIDEADIDGVHYTIFGLDSDGGNFHLIFNNWNNNKQLPDFDIVANRDYWLMINDEGVTEITPSIVIENFDSVGNQLKIDGDWILSDSGSSVTVFNIQGQKIISGIAPRVSIATLPAGVYIVNDGCNVLKFVKR